MKEIQELLLERRDEAYAVFQRRLIPTIDPETVIGVRTPALRRLARSLAGTKLAEEFLDEDPHRYFEENQLHGFLLSEIRDFASCIVRLEAFLPRIDNWATCDQTSPKVFRKHREELLPYIRKWLRSGRTYTVRFGIGMLMQHFLDEDFDPEYLRLAAEIRSEEYYVNMELAWYMATALAKQWEAAVPYLENRRLDPRVHRKTIQKAVESRRIGEEQKNYLRSLRN